MSGTPNYLKAGDINRSTRSPLSKVCFILDVMTVTSDARRLINAYFIYYLFIIVQDRRLSNSKSISLLQPSLQVYITPPTIIESLYHSFNHDCKSISLLQPSLQVYITPPTMIASLYHSSNHH